jgi:hypothetical protein
MAWSSVGNPGNAADPLTGFGAVPYSYNIGTYDVTNSQYVAFLNANDPTGADPLVLYIPAMSNPVAGDLGGINFNPGAPAGQKYSIIFGDGSNPVNYVSWYSAVRFANWMDNGQPIFGAEPNATNNATDNGAYTLLGYEATPSNFLSITRNVGATIFVPSENEWYKAAFYNAANSSYYLYPTSSNTAPTATFPTATPNSANYNDVVENLTAVGAYSGTTSPYGAYDMVGDVIQWNDAPFNGSCILNGAAFSGQPSDPESFELVGGLPATELSIGIGFRLASVPEPSTMALAALAGLGVIGLAWYRRRSAIRLAKEPRQKRWAEKVTVTRAEKEGRKGDSHQIWIKYVSLLNLSRLSWPSPGTDGRLQP